MQEKQEIETVIRRFLEDTYLDIGIHGKKEHPLLEDELKRLARLVKSYDGNILVIQQQGNKKEDTLKINKYGKIVNSGLYMVP